MPRSWTLLLIASLAACSSTTATTAPGNNPALATAQAEPPHRFTPRAHPAHVHTPPPPADMGALPALVDRTRQCFGPPQTWRPGGGPPPPKPVKKKKPRKTGRARRPKREPAPGFVPYEPSPSKGSGATTPATVAPSGGGSGGGGVVGNAPAAVAKDSAPTDTKPERKRKRRRSRNRGSKADASPAAPPAEPAPEPEPEPAAPDVALSEQSLDDRADGDANAGAPVAPLSVAQPDPDDQFQDWGASTYLSNDDTMSLSSAQRVIFAIDNFLPLPAEHVRPHELLNYFSFDMASVGETDDFSVHASVGPNPKQEGTYTLALGVRGRPMGIDDRRNANLAYVVDVSGSMRSEGRMDFLKRGLNRSLEELKRGDIVHLVIFDNQVCTPIENFVVGRDSPSVLRNAINMLKPRGATNLHAGLNEGYAVADRAYQRTHTNRVIMVTDAQTNTGVTDEELIATVGEFYDRRQIRLSGVGVGSDFNDSLLDRLTERGRGAYVFLGSPAEVDAVFGPRFVSLVETTAVDVHFQLHLPPSLRMNVFYGEESSTIKEDVQSIHYFANTSQLFLSDLMARGGQLRDQDDIMLTIEYDEPESGQERIEEYAFNLAEIQEQTRNVDKGRVIMHFVDGLAWMASRPTSRSWGARQAGWDDGEAWEVCEQSRGELSQMARSVSDDPEVRRVLGLWDKYCARFARPREPVRRPPASDTWPGAAG